MQRLYTYLSHTDNKEQLGFIYGNPESNTQK